MDLVRKILFEVEKQGEQGVYWPRDKTIEGYDDLRVRNHIKLLDQRGLIEIGKTNLASQKIHGLTWEGYDFLDAIREDKIWNKTKQTLAEKGYGLTFDLVKHIATELMKAQL